MADFSPFTSNWNKAHATHLLKRTIYGPSAAMINDAVAMGFNDTIDALFDEQPLPDPPLKYIPDGTANGQLNDPGTLYGESWVNGPHWPVADSGTIRNKIIADRYESLYGWVFSQMYNNGISIIDKVTMFWHNHFVVSNFNLPHRMYNYYKLLRTHALGDVIQLTKEMTVDPGMLIYLSGAANTNTAPNENYARELLELFTIGKGDLVAPGDYTNYTEDDILAIAKALTGWRVTSASHEDALTGYYQDNRHYEGDKQLSFRFDNAVIEEHGDDEYKDIVDIIFEQDECSRYLCRELYRWFVSTEISDEIETDIIAPMAEIMRDNDYEIGPALKALVKSKHFFDVTKCMIKSPIDLIMGCTRSLGLFPPTSSVYNEYLCAYKHYFLCHGGEQRVFFHPDVAGWKAFYQKPLYDRLWINNLLLPMRQLAAQKLVTGGTIKVQGKNYSINNTIPVLEVVAELPNATNPNDLINGLAELMFSSDINASQVSALKGSLIPGLPDFEWTVEYGAYLLDPTNNNLKEAVESKLKTLFSAMLSMSEFQIM